MPCQSPRGLRGLCRARDQEVLKDRMPRITAEPYEFDFDPRTAALLIIDMQRDFPRARRVRRVARQRCEPAAP